MAIIVSRVQFLVLHHGGYYALFKILRQRGDSHNAQRLCLWRLSQLPDDIDTHMDYLHALSENYQREKATKQILSMRENMGDRPLSLTEANIIYSHYFQKPKVTLHLIEKARDTGQMSKRWLDYFELMTRASAGHIFKKRQMLEEQIEINPNDPDLVVELADTYFKTGRLKKTISLCRRGLSLGPNHRRNFQVIKTLTYLLYLPILWPAGVFFLFHHIVVRRLSVFGQIIAFALTIGAGAAIVKYAWAGLTNFWPGFSYELWTTFVFINAIWVCADLFLMDFLDADIGEDKTSIKLSKDY